MVIFHYTRHWCTEPCTERPIHVLSRKLVLNMPKEPCVAEDSQGDDSAVPTTKQEYTETATLTFNTFSIKYRAAVL